MEAVRSRVAQHDPAGPSFLGCTPTFKKNLSFNSSRHTSTPPIWQKLISRMSNSNSSWKMQSSVWGAKVKHLCNSRTGNISGTILASFSANFVQNPSDQRRQCYSIIHHQNGERSPHQIFSPCQAWRATACERRPEGRGSNRGEGEGCAGKLPSFLISFSLHNLRWWKISNFYVTQIVTPLWSHPAQNDVYNS